MLTKTKCAECKYNNDECNNGKLTFDCAMCHGTGEGFHDGSSCIVCRGRGYFTEHCFNGSMFEVDPEQEGLDDRLYEDFNGTTIF